MYKIIIIKNSKTVLHAPAVKGDGNPDDHYVLFERSY